MFRIVRVVPFIPFGLNCDASRISAGVLFRDCVAALFKFFNALPCSAPNASKIHPEIAHPAEAVQRPEAGKRVVRWTPGRPK